MRNKKIMDMTVAETVKTSLVLSLIGVALGALPFGIAALVEGRKVPKVDDLEVKEDEDEE